MTTVMITGANRGIGLKFAEVYAAEGAKVIATCRKPENAADLRALSGDIEVVGLDVADDAAVKDLAAAKAGHAIDVLINNAGVYGPRSYGIDAVDYQAWHQVFEVNCMAALRIAGAFQNHVASSGRKIIANITSKMGSIADNGSGGAYLYRSSKAALNAVTKSLAMDLKSRGIIAVVLHPGWVQTDMGGPNALIDTNTSVGGMKNTLDHLDMSQTGSFFDYDGSIIPW